MKPMQPPLPAGLPAKGVAFIRLGIKFDNGSKLQLDGRLRGEQGFVVWDEAVSRLLGRHKVGQDAGIEAAWSRP